MAAQRVQQRLLFACAVCCSASLGADPARAMDVDVSASTAAQGYSLRSPDGAPILMRRRFMQTLGMNVTNIGTEQFDPEEPWVSFRVRLRLDADFGVHSDETDWADYPGGFVPGLKTAPVDLMYGYLDVRNLADGVLSFRIGRQYVVDPLGWWSFDGALTRVELPVFLAFETYGGFEQRGGLPWSTPRFERDGVWRGDRTGLDANVYPEFQQAHYAPAAGAVVESFGLPLVHMRVAWRKVWNTGPVVTNPLPASSTALPPSSGGWRVSSERVGASVDIDDEDIGSLRSGVVYDLFLSRLTSSYASADAFASRRVTVGADVDRVVPSFDADSIWNVFGADPSSTALLRADVQITDRLDTGLSGGARWVQAADDTGEHGVDGLGTASARYRLDTGTVGMSASAAAGGRGRREGADLFGDRAIDRRFLLSGRVSLYDWRDAWRPDRSATSFGYVLGSGYRIDDLTEVMVEWEHDTNKLVGQRYRILALLNLQVTR